MNMTPTGIAVLISSVAGNGTAATVDGTTTSASFTDMGGVVMVGAYAYVGTRGAIRRVNKATGRAPPWPARPLKQMGQSMETLITPASTSTV